MKYCVLPSYVWTYPDIHSYAEGKASADLISLRNGYATFQVHLFDLSDDSLSVTVDGFEAELYREMAIGVESCPGIENPTEHFPERIAPFSVNDCLVPINETAEVKDGTLTLYIAIRIPSDIADEFVYTANKNTTPIKEGEIPDPIYPLKKIGGRFQLNGGKSQAFLIRIKTESDTPAGWYSAQLDIKNSAGEVVKTATVFCYVWDFELSEETAFETAVYLGNDTTYGGSYQKFYDYLLENRIVAMDVPGGLSPDNPYLTNPRVNSIRVTYGGGGANNSYGEIGTDVEYFKYLDVYNKLSTSDVWDEVKDKFYFYTADEPVGAVWNKLTGSKNATVDDVKTFYEHLSDYWEDNPDPVPLLYQTGYLSIRDHDRAANIYTLGFPNIEVEYGFLESLMPEYVADSGAGFDSENRMLTDWEVN